MSIPLTLLLLLRLCLLQEVAAQDMEQWQGQLEAFKKQLHVEKQQGEAAVELAAARLTIAEGQELEARCQEVRWGGICPCDVMQQQCFMSHVCSCQPGGTAQSADQRDSS
jgi:hypothetical protein